MIHLVIDNLGRRKEYAEGDALWLLARSTIVACAVPHYDDSHTGAFIDKCEATVYHPGTRNNHIISMEDVDSRLKERPVVDTAIMCQRCKQSIESCTCPPRGIPARGDA